ncbi:hypothetical protein C0991_012328 [Blastosporella zonata]|nr:hypothetical protein C0991_012328 [Blastosporella zonata]
MVNGLSKKQREFGTNVDSDWARRRGLDHTFHLYHVHSPYAPQLNLNCVNYSDTSQGIHTIIDTTMSNDELRVLAVTTLTSLVSSGKLSLPMSAMSLLTRVVSTKVPSGLFANPSSPNIRFRLTDQSRFEKLLEELSQTWVEGSISLSRENGVLTVQDITLYPSGHTRPVTEAVSGDTTSRKRKRVIDEDADSAAGDEETEETYEELGSNATSTLASLSKEMREVYAILQRSTARGRLLAEQSPSIPFPATTHGHSQVPPNTRGPASLPSGLGAGGRGKEKAPCRYLHYEIDWDDGDGEATKAMNGKGKEVGKRKIHKLGIGQGPAGKAMSVVRIPYQLF